MAIGKKVSKKTPLLLAADSHKNAAKMPCFLLQAHRIANTVIAGWHGQRKRGNGENFWQFRPYVEGESITRIDWRRSARDEHTYLREHEWEKTQTVWIWPDQSASMHYCSCFSQTSKDNYAIILALTLATLLARSGENIAIPTLMPPTMAPNVVERMALALVNRHTENPFPDFSTITRFSHVIIMSDFLDSPEKIIQNLTVLSAKQITVHLIEVADPAEEHFPYAGHTEFFDPETKEKRILGKAENSREHYCKLYQARRQELTNFCTRQGWTYHVSKTDRPLTEVILRLANKIGISPSHNRRSL
ncbi:hypothetical protein BHOIPH791_11250 [Bartonella henselae]|uniref:DUF58 domain-containing protein n=1 Tax=Bartonella henselae TaxID=38323 RepID=UPI0003DF82AE|nr:DUF58 domain-containing protein [Bartonella henselae]ATP12675.1 DUF58 domain-containing protein [Bartonella henselae]ETS08293.1 hypothetical protein Q654_01166 [Bartonella henselae JK 50]ETS08842.1 hypothetical protein Q655_01120 [Bartonella henselae JK 51]ETS11393.1 hypothetical protein Q653_00315 [Bartonella henselae JK 42]ETS15398.1 hypothetical protein Q652_00447 [Bartonella henselae JK 41]